MPLILFILEFYVNLREKWTFQSEEQRWNSVHIFLPLVGDFLSVRFHENMLFPFFHDGLGYVLFKGKRWPHSNVPIYLYTRS